MNHLRFSGRFFRKGHFTVLLIALALYLFVLPPLVQGHELLTLFLRIGVALVFFAACYAMSASRRAFRIAVTLAALAVALSWTAEFTESILVVRSASVARIAFLTWTLLLFLRHVLGDAPVTLDKLFGAICVYLLLGLACAEMFTLIFAVNPGSFVVNDALRQQIEQSGAQSVFIYFSFVALTTLGFGDISPVSLAARCMTAFAAVSGPLYLAILIAHLVGAMAAPSTKRAI